MAAGSRVKPIRPGQIKDPHLKRVLDRFHDIVNGNIDYGGIQGGGFSPGTVSMPGNVNSVHVKVTFANPGDVDVTVTHNLNRIPTGYKLVSSNNPVSIYNGSVAFTTTQITLRGHLLSANAAVVVLEIY